MTQEKEITLEAVALLRHTLATLAYRSAKALRDAPAGFASFQAANQARTPAEILAHMGDLMDWALSIAEGAPTWKASAPLEWDAECARWFAALEALDRRLAAGNLQRRPERIFQAPIADALTHTGQIGMLRRLAGAPVRGENYYAAPIEAGRAGAAQDPPGMEFDGRPLDS